MSTPTAFVDGHVHEPSQVRDDGVDLTVATIERLTGRGRADFGGDEYAAPETEPITPEERDAGDDYGWWDLDAGTYLLTYNESLASESVPFVLQPHRRLVALGATHPTAYVTDLDRVPLTVPERGVALKENARVSRLVDTK